MAIHNTAIIHPKAKLGKDNVIGPSVYIEEGVVIGDNNWIGPNACIFNGSTIGDNNEIHMGAIVGGVPQDVAFKNLPSFTKIGNGNKIREYVTIHRGTKEGSSTIIGNNNFIMTQCHVAHNCHIGNNAVFVPFAGLSGHCIIEDGAFLSGMVGLHQYSRVGRLAIISALSAVNKDIPPYMMCGGRPAVCYGINSVGLRRAGIKPAARSEIKQAFKILYRSGLNVTNACAKIKEELKSEEIAHLLKFIESSERGIAAGGTGKDAKLQDEEEE